MSALLCCRRAAPAPATSPDMGAAISQPPHHHQEGEECAAEGLQPAPATMADLIRERKKKAGGGAALGTLRRRLAAAAARRAPHPRRAARNDRGCEHGRQLRAIVSSWRVAEVAALRDELEAAAALRDLATQAELAREPAPRLHAALWTLHADGWGCDAQLLHRGTVFPVHRALLAARCSYFRDLLANRPDGHGRYRTDGAGALITAEELEAVLAALYGGPDYANRAGAGRRCDGCSRHACCPMCHRSRGCAVGGGEAECGGGECCARASDLDVISADPHAGRRAGRAGRTCACAAGGGRRADAALLARLADQLGFRPDALHADMKYLLDSGEYADTRLVFSYEAGAGGAASAGAGVGGSEYGFRAALELPCHRAVLAARSRYFRNMLSRRGEPGNGCGGRGRCPGGSGSGSGSGSGGGGVALVCVDEKVLPRRFARALLHAAYTDQLDLSLIGRNGSSPGSGSGAPSSWAANMVSGGGGGGGLGLGAPGGGKTSSWGRAHAQLEDTFQLYEIARFVEMPLVVQRCEDAIVEALSAEALPHVLRWSAAPHASQWVHRQAMRYLRDEFTTLCSRGAVARLNRSALAEALASPFLQASEPHALRSLLRWGEHHAQRDNPAREPNVVWHTAHSMSRRGVSGGGGGGGRRRGVDVSDAVLRETIAPLLHHIRLEHVPPDCDLLQQAIRRGLISTPPSHMMEGGGGGVDAWLGRPPHRAPRLFLPYLDELRALLAGQSVPASEVARVRRARYIHRIPDTLYMVQAERDGNAGGSGDGAAPSGNAAGGGPWWVSPGAVRRLAARVRELRAAPPVARAMRHPAADASAIHTQIALRAVREMSLPDACAELLADVADVDTTEPEVPDAQPDRHPPPEDRECSPWRRSITCGSDSDSEGESRGAGAGGGGGAPRWDELADDDDCCRYRRHNASRGGGGDSRSASAGSLRSVHTLHLADVGRAGGGDGRRRDLPALVAEGHPHRYSPGGGAGRLSMAVPDVAQAPDANMHLLPAQDYFRQRPLPSAAQHPHSAPLQPHAPFREYGLGGASGVGGVGGALLQLDLGDGATHAPRPGSRAQRAAARLQRDQHAQAASRAPPPPPADELRAAFELSLLRAYSSLRPRSLSPAAGSAGGEVRAPRGPPPAPLQAATLPHPHPGLERLQPPPGAIGGGSSGGAGSSTLSLRSVSGGAALVLGGRPRHDYAAFRHHHAPDYRLEGAYGASAGGSRGPSPSNYA